MRRMDFLRSGAKAPYFKVAPQPTDEFEGTTPPEIERLKQLMQEYSSGQGGCDTSGGEIEIKDADLVKVHEVVLDIGRTIRDTKISTIYAVPPEILSCDEKAYVPKAVCVGPFFHDLRYEKHLKSMQYYKWECVHKLMSKQNDPIEVLLRKCLTKMKELEACVRSKYSEKFRLMKSDAFARMLMLDGCFLLHLLLRHSVSAEVDDEDARPVVGRLWIWDLVRYDLLLLQNQIPFFVIQSLYELLKPDDNNTNLVDCAINFFSPLDPCRKQKQPKFHMPVEDVHHLLHLIYLSVLPCPQDCKSSPKTQSPPWIPSATELKQAGMKFTKRKKKGGFLSFLDVKFSNGVMKIPQLKVHDYSISLFRNFIAFEQCYADTQCHVTVYAAFMDFLINTEEDVKLLYLNGILINCMTVDKDATHFFSRLCNEVHHAHDRNYLLKLFNDVTECRDSKWRRIRSVIVREYISSPSTVIGLLGLYLTASGTITDALSGFLSFFRQK